MKGPSRTKPEPIKENSSPKHKFKELEESETMRGKDEEALQKSDSFYHTFFDLVPDPMAITDFDNGRIADVNEAFVAWSHYSRDELTGRTTAELGFWVDNESRRAVLDRLRNTGFVGEIEIEFRRARGELRQIVFSGKLIEIGSNKWFLSVAHDITDRKRAENELRENEALLKTYLENAPDGIYMSDMNGNFLYGNRRSEEIIGYGRDELIGKNFLELGILSEKSLNKAAALLQANIEGRSTGPDEIELINKEGCLIPVEINTSVVQHMGQRIVLAFVRDITERKRAEEALKNSEAKYRALFENAVEGIFQTTPEGRFISANPAQARVFGFDSPQELMEQFIDIGRQHYANPQDRETYKNTLEREGMIRGFEAQLLKKDGSPVWASINARAVRDSEGAVIYYEGTLEDITDRKHAKEALRENELFLEETQRIARLGGWKANPHTDYLEWTRGVYEIIEAPHDYKPGLSEGLKVFSA